MTLRAPTESHEQLRALYQALLTSQDCFDEFKRLLQLYDVDPQSDDEPADASAVRQRLNDRIRSWFGGPFEDLSATQVMQWRGIIVEERFNLVHFQSPWRESSGY
jgi:hypothetical protein